MCNCDDDLMEHKNISETHIQFIIQGRKVKAI
jgi:hypothetical protein